MNKKIRHIISTGLLVVFLIPILSKGIDFVFHDHHHIVCTTKTEKHFHTYQKDCYIASFTFSFFIYQKQRFVKFKKLLSFTENQSLTVLNFTKSPYFSFLLRGPPFIKEFFQ